MRLLVALVAALTAGGVAAAAAGAPEVGSVTTIDRTLACTVEGNRLQRGIGVSATTRTANTPATIYANHKGGYADVLAGIGPTHGLGFNVQTPAMAQWLWLNRKRCTRARTSIAFTARGLTGGRVGFHDGAGCATPARVLVRIRATFVRDTGLAHSRRQCSSRGQNRGAPSSRSQTARTGGRSRTSGSTARCA